MNFKNFTTPYPIPLMGNFGGPVAPPAGPPEEPDYSDFSYPSVQTGYGANLLSGGANFNAASQSPYEYGSGQIGNNAAPTPYYGVAAPEQAPISLIPSHTSSKDPNAMKSRLFVGNLNTAVVNRDQVHQIFCPFGQIVGISMHKGFAFVQFAFESEARNAVTFTDGTLLGGKKIDVTISSEPKTQHSPNDPSAGIKRQADAPQSIFGQPSKKPMRSEPVPLLKTTTTGFAAFKKAQGGIAGKPVASASKASSLSTTNGTGAGVGAALKQEILAKGDDILICGRCRQLFTNTALFTGHKPKCTVPPVLVKEEQPEVKGKEKEKKEEAKPDPKELARKGKPDGEPDQIQCFICHMAFDYSWYLLQHMSQSHSMTVYEPLPAAE